MGIGSCIFFVHRAVKLEKVNKLDLLKELKERDICGTFMLLSGLRSKIALELVYFIHLMHIQALPYFH